MAIAAVGRSMKPVWLALLLVAATWGDAPIVEAVKSGDREALQALLREGADVDERTGDGSTALLWASYRDDVESAELLIRAGAHVNAANDLGATPIWAASRNGSAAMARLLLDAGAEVEAPLLLGETPLVTASRSGNAEVVRLLLEAGAEINARGARGQTPLMFAAAQKHAEVVEVLLEHGADVHARSHVWNQVMAQPPHAHPEHMKEVLMGGNTALLFAVYAGDLASAKALVAGGADVNAPSAWGFTPLTVATYTDFQDGYRVYEGDLVPLDGERGVPGQFPELVEFLLEAGADPNGGAERFTAFHAAVLRENERFVELMLEAGADPNLPVGDWTPVERGNPADYIHRSWVGATPLWLAARFSTPGVVQRLLDAGADPSSVHRGEYYGGSPGGVLSERIEEVTTPLLAAVGSARAGRAWNRTTPAFARGEVVETDESRVLEIVKLLVERGADVHAVDGDGNNAVVGALRSGYESVAEFLVANGAAMPDRPVLPPAGRRGGG